MEIDILYREKYIYYICRIFLKNKTNTEISAKIYLSS